VATVLNTDTIKVLVEPGGFADLILAGGPFAPGATAEPEGESEIEVQFVGDDLLAAVRGTRRANWFEWWPGPDRQAGLNLNPGVSGDQDVDVTVEGNFATLNAVGRGGNDSIVPVSGAVFSGGHVFSTAGKGDDRLEAPSDGSGFLEGGPGDDVLIGGGRYDALFGGGGSDEISGARGNDRIDGGPGRDVIRAGSGHDHIEARDSTRDIVRCGPGPDLVKADGRDRLRGCEAVRR
jgi:Ca2+-binding RTX toxin-like protein